MKSFNKNEILDLIQDNKKLKEAIIESKGFILYQAETYKINISKTLLMDTIDQYSIRFIIEDMKKNDYSKKDIEVITSFLKEDTVSKNDLEVLIDYSIEKLLIDLEEDKTPRNVSDLIKLSFQDFLEHQEKLVKLFSINVSDYYSYNAFEKYHKILHDVLKDINKEDFLKINIDTLAKSPSLFNMAKHLMVDKDIKELFNKVVKLHHEIPEVKKGGYRPKLDYYKHYDFDITEKELFITLNINAYSQDYEKVKEHISFDKFFTKLDYVLNHDIKSIQYLSKKEISDNLNEIRASIKKLLGGNYFRFESLYELRIDESSFKNIFSKDFIKEFVTEAEFFDFVYFDRDYQKKTDFSNYFHKQIYDLAANDTKFLELVGFQKIMGNLSSLIEHNRKYFDEDYKESLNKIFPQFPQMIKTHNLFNNVENNKYESPNGLIKTNLTEAIQGHETPNYLFFLLLMTNEKQGSFYKEEIDKVIPLLNPNEAINVCNLFNYKIDKKLLNKNNRQISKYEDNFFSFNLDIAKEMPEDVFANVLWYSPGFRDLVLENNLDKKLLNTEKNRDNIISKMLNNLKEENSPYVNFMQRFIHKNKDYMLKEYFNELITHTQRDKLIKINTQDLENNSYKIIESLLGEYKVLEIKHNKASSKNLDDLSKKQKNLEYDKIEKISKEKRIVEDQLKEQAKNLSFNFCEEKIKSNDIENTILLERIFKNSHRETIINLVKNFEFDKFKSLLESRLFLIFIESARKDDNRRGELFLTLNDKYTDKQNIELVEIMLKNFNNNEMFKAKYEKNISLSKVFSLISEESKYRISNDLVIKHDPENMFNGYDYMPERGGYFKKHVTERFSTEQLLQAIENLNKKGKKIICVENSNLSHDNMLSANYKYEEYEKDNSHKKKNVKNPYLNEYLDLLKNLENDPINYLVCIHPDIINNFTNREEYKFSDESKSAFYNKYINVDVVIQAMKDIFSIEKEKNETKNYNEGFYKGIVTKNAISAITNFLAFTYHSDSNDKNVSHFEEEKAKAILKVVMDYAPNLYFTISSIGKLGRVSEELNKNINEYYTDDFVEKYFLKNNKTNIISDTLNLSYEKRKEYWQSTKADDMINTVIDFLINTQNIKDLHKLDFILKEYDFNETQRGYDKSLSDYDTYLTNFANNDEYKLKIEKGLLFMNLAEEINNTTPTTKNKRKKL